MDDTTLAGQIGERARALRLARRWTLQQVSDRSGLTLSRLGRIELGQRELSAAGLVRLAAALDVNVGALLGESVPGDPVVALADALPGDPEEMRRRVLSALRALAGG